ncbi:hypothetical protein B0H13DRAFT_1873251 [Mycena leptocephala]|nr:hypothetical protein B0H13DRAFT_1873251 [Mycena leptocephala]
MPSQPFITSAASLSLFLSVLFSYILDTVSSMNREKMLGSKFSNATRDSRWSVAKAYLVSYSTEIVRINCGILMSSASLHRSVGPTYRRPGFFGGGFAAAASPARGDWTTGVQEPRKKPLRAAVELEVALAAA